MYLVKIEPEAIKDLKKMDNFMAKRVTNYLQKNIQNIVDPRSVGKALSNMDPINWRYRVGKIRILCEIDDCNNIIYVVAVAHRRESY